MARSTAGAFSAKEYEDAKKRVRRLDACRAATTAKSPEDGATSTPATLRKGKQQQGEDDFAASLQRNLVELRESILGRLTPYPQLQGLLDGDFKEMQLHLDRLFLHNHTERERHEQEVAKLSLAWEQTLAAEKLQQEANLRAMQLAALEQREHLAQEDAKARTELTALLENERAEAREREDAWEKRIAQELQRQQEKMLQDFAAQRREDSERKHAAIRAAREEERAESERVREQALDELADELIPKIEQQLERAHHNEIKKYHKRCEELNKKVEALELLETQCRAEVEDANARSQRAERQVATLTAEKEKCDAELTMQAQMLQVSPACLYVRPCQGVQACADPKTGQERQLQQERRDEEHSAEVARVRAALEAELAQTRAAASAADSARETVEVALESATAKHVHELQA